ncbi:hypothetical protein ABZS76_27555 [Streptomyces sp. NPDC005562]|uniref:hypothetical protein n=1 Tax=Streptomyces sp. NPDC005562 TaxID=3154890 RepID=UPI0033AB0BC6
MRRESRYGRGRGRPLAAAVARAAAVATTALLLGACTTDHTPPHVKDGRADLDLSVTGQPSSEALALVEKALVRIQRQDEEGLPKLSYDGEDAEKAAEKWVAKWGDAAQRPMTADFAVDPKKYVTVTIRFRGVRGVLPLTLEADTDDDWAYGIVTGKEDDKR